MQIPRHGDVSRVKRPVRTLRLATLPEYFWQLRIISTLKTCSAYRIDMNIEVRERGQILDLEGSVA